MKFTPAQVRAIKKLARRVRQRAADGPESPIRRGYTSIPAATGTALLKRGVVEVQRVKGYGYHGVGGIIGAQKGHFKTTLQSMTSWRLTLKGVAVAYELGLLPDKTRAAIDAGVAVV